MMCSLFTVSQDNVIYVLIGSHSHTEILRKIFFPVELSQFLSFFPQWNHGKMLQLRKKEQTYFKISLCTVHNVGRVRYQSLQQLVLFITCQKSCQEYRQSVSSTQFLSRGPNFHSNERA